MLLLKNKLGVFYYVHLAISKLLSVALCLLLTGVLSAGFIAYALRTVPVSITPLMMLNQSRKKAPPQKRWVPIDKVSSNIIHAVIASEDNNFFYHNGFDVEAIKWALKRNQEQSKKVYGASTISQQTAKNVFLLPDRTWLRKAVEAGFTVLIEGMWSKARIMEVYLNVIETGRNLYGVEAAAQRYFGKSAEQLDMNESTLIAISLPGPYMYNPASPSPYMLRRQAQIYEVIDKTLNTGWYKYVKDIKKIKVNYLDQY